MKKIILSGLIFIIGLCLLTATVSAGEGGGGASLDTLVTSFEGAGISSGDTSENGITKAIDSILGLVQIAGTGVALIAVSLLGVKYMLASVEDKAEIKKYLVGAVIGGLLIFGGTSIAKMLASFTDTIFGAGT